MSTFDAGRGPASESELLVGVLSEKAVSLGEQVTDLLPKMENLLGVSVAIAGAIISFGVTQKHPVILVLLPFPFFVLYTYLLQSNTEMLSRAGHKRLLEEKINELVEGAVARAPDARRVVAHRLMLEESDVAVPLHGRTGFGRLSVILIQLTLILLLLGTIAIAIVHLGVVHHVAWKIVFGVGVLAGFGMLLAAAKEQSTAYKDAYRAAKEGFEHGPRRTDPLLTEAWVRLRLARWWQQLTQVLNKRNPAERDDPTSPP